jgi:hypothetical protein
VKLSTGYEDIRFKEEEEKIILHMTELELHSFKKNILKQGSQTNYEDLQAKK